MSEPSDVEAIRLKQRRIVRELVVETFGHQDPVHTADLDVGHKILEKVRSVPSHAALSAKTTRSVLLHKTCCKVRFELESIDLPNVNIALREGTAQLRRCTKARLRVRQEGHLRSVVTKLIRVDSELYRAQKEQEECYNSYLSISESCAKLSCRQMCERMQSKLPREVRDMIYQHMVGCGSVVLAPSSSRQAHRIALPRHRELDLGRPPPLIKDPDYWQDIQAAAAQYIFNYSFVGFDTLSELVQVWYGATTFITSDLFLLRSFLLADPWYLRFNTCQLLRKFVVQIPESSVRTLANKVHNFRRNGQDHFRVDIVPGRDNSVLFNQFAHLIMLKAHTKVLLHIVPGPDYTHNNTFEVLPVDVWHKNQLILPLLLEGLHVVWQVLESLVPMRGDVELCLDAEGQCVLNKHNAVWSPLGWLAKTMEFGYEQEAKVKVASRDGG